MPAMSCVPATAADDSCDVAEALEVARRLWERGERADAIRWVRRAAEAADEADQTMRVVALARAAAELDDSVRASSVPPPPPSQTRVMANPSAPPRPSTLPPRPTPTPIAPRVSALATTPAAPPPPKETRMRVSLRESLRDGDLLVVRLLPEGQPVPPGTREAFLVIPEE